MVNFDFTSKYKVPIEQIIEAAKQKSASNASPLINAIPEATKGLQQGLKMSEEMNTIMEAKKRRKALADAMQTPQYKEANDALGGILSAVEPKDAIDAITKIQAEKVKSSQKEQPKRVFYRQKGIIWAADDPAKTPVNSVPGDALVKDIADESPFAKLQEQRIKGNLIDKFNNDEIVKKQRASLSAAMDIENLVKNNSPIEATSIPTYMARLSGEVGNLSEMDKKPFGGSIAIKDKLKQVGTNWAKGTLTPENQQFVLKFVETIKKRKQQQIEYTARQRAKQYSRVKGYGTEEEILDMLNPKGINDFNTDNQNEDELANAIQALIQIKEQ